MFKSNILLVALAVCLSLCTALGVVPVAAQGVLVFGGTGQLGAYHVRLLVERGEDVAVFVRPHVRPLPAQGLKRHLRHRRPS